MLLTLKKLLRYDLLLTHCDSVLLKQLQIYHRNTCLYYYVSILYHVSFNCSVSLQSHPYTTRTVNTMMLVG